jgi:hypothetical protein
VGGDRWQRPIRIPTWFGVGQISSTTVPIRRMTSASLRLMVGDPIEFHDSAPD